MTDTSQKDIRIEKTLEALREAFFELVLSRSYDEIRVSDIIAQANVGRSTFYQHYKSKDELLATSMKHPLQILAHCIQSDFPYEHLQWLMEHFWENRKFAPRIFSGKARKLIVSELAVQLESSLKAMTKLQVTTTCLPINMVAHQLAETQLTVIIDWLLGKGNCTPAEMATHVCSTSKAVYQSSLKCM